MAPETYVIEGGMPGRERLRLLSRILRPQTLDLLARAGIAEGMACLDVGCGGGDASVEMARLVGPSGAVLGTDFDGDILAIARREAQALGLANLDYRLADAADPPPTERRFDLVLARQLLCHVPDPKAVLARMIAHARPGGLVVVEDIDFSGHFCHPPCPEFDEFQALFRQAARARGGNPDIGPELPLMLGAAGLGEVRMQVAQPAGFEGEVKLIHPVTMEAIAGRLVAGGLATVQDVARIAGVLHRRAGDTHTVMSLPRYVQAWGRVP